MTILSVWLTFFGKSSIILLTFRIFNWFLKISYSRGVKRLAPGWLPNIPKSLKYPKSAQFHAITDRKLGNIGSLLLILWCVLRSLDLRQGRKHAFLGPKLVKKRYKLCVYLNIVVKVEYFKYNWLLSALNNINTTKSKILWSLMPYDLDKLDLGPKLARKPQILFKIELKNTIFVKNGGPRSINCKK